MNVFFNFRSPAPNVVPLALLLISYPMGKFLAFTLPITTYRIPLPRLPRIPFLSRSTFPLRRPGTARPQTAASAGTALGRASGVDVHGGYGGGLSGAPGTAGGAMSVFSVPPTPHTPSSLPRPRNYLEFSLNPGPWNIKEHVLVYIMANVAVGSPYALNAIVVSEVYYEIHLGFWFNLVLVLATQLTGFGLAGMCRRFLVWPASMVWPQNLVACTLLNTLHAEEDEAEMGVHGEPESKVGGITRYKFFMLVTLGSFLYFFLPGGYLDFAKSIPTLTRTHRLPVLRAVDLLVRLLGSTEQCPCEPAVWRALGPRDGRPHVRLDADQLDRVAADGALVGRSAHLCRVRALLLDPHAYPLLHQREFPSPSLIRCKLRICAPQSWYLAHFPISANEPYDRFGKTYNITRVLRHDDTFDLDAYAAYSPLYLPATYAMTYLLAFALSTCVIVHTALYHGRSLWNGVKKIRVEPDDIHAKLMRSYPEVPDWWYASAFLFFFALAIVAVEVWNTGVPVWALLLSIMLPVIYILPSGFIYAMTGQPVSSSSLSFLVDKLMDVAMAMV